MAHSIVSIWFHQRSAARYSLHGPRHRTSHPKKPRAVCLSKICTLPIRDCVLTQYTWPVKPLNSLLPGGIASRQQRTMLHCIHNQLQAIDCPKALQRYSLGEHQRRYPVQLQTRKSQANHIRITHVQRQNRLSNKNRSIECHGA